MSAMGQLSRDAATNGRGSRGLPAASLPESIAVLATGVLPAVIRGLFSPRRTAMRLLSALDADRRTVQVLRSLRRRYGGEGIRLLGGRIVVLWGAGAIREVLDDSATTYASDSGAKARGMSHFQPDALTLSRGAQWRDRRAFNEAVLATREHVHPDARRFLAVIDDEVGRLRIDGTLRWEHWERLFDHVALRVVFGDRARGDARLTDLLEKLMSEANRLVGLSHGDDYYAFYGELERHLRDPEPGGLVARFAHAPHTDRTRTVHQIPHWLFAIRDTLAANAYRALAAIAADPLLEQAVREELEHVDPADPESVASAQYLGGCLHEAMRLWPTTPLLAREAVCDTTLAGERVDEGTQVMMLNVFNHRDGDHVEDANRFVPGRWAAGRPDYRFNHLSNGSQDCPGGPLVLLLGRAVLARLLREYTVRCSGRAIGAGPEMPYSLNFYELAFSVWRRPGA